MIHLEQVVTNGVPTNIYISYWDTDGKKQLKKLDIPKSELYEWEECDDYTLEYADKNYISAFGNKVRKVPLKKYRKLSKYRIYELLNKLPEELKTLFFSPNHPQKTYFDIETESKGSFPDADNPKHMVLSNVFVTNNIVDMYGIKSLTPDDVNNIENMINNHVKKINDRSLIKEKYIVNYTHCESEEKLMMAINHKKRYEIDMLLGWNSLKFDEQYLSNRGITMYGIDLHGIQSSERNYKFMRSSSPTNNHFVLRMIDKFAKTDEKVLVPVPYHSPTLDYMEIYSKFDRSIKTSLSLDATAKSVLGLNKISYSGNLHSLYDNDFVTFMFYNAIDTILVQLIDKKVGTFNTPISLASLVGVPIHDSLFAGILCEKMFCDWYYNNNQVFIDGINHNDKASYTGGFVLEPKKKGMIDDVMIYDFTSMFPSGMMAFNYGIDTLIGKSSNNKTFINKNTREEENIDFSKHVLSPNGIVYTKEHGDSSLRKMVFNLFNGRVERKRWSKEVVSEIKSLKENGSVQNPKHAVKENWEANSINEIFRLEKLAMTYDNDANAMKIIMNSIYGVLGWTGFPLYNIDVASSVTAQSRDIIQYTIKEFNDFFINEWSTNIDLHKKLNVTVTKPIDYETIIYADTDSVFLTVKDVINNTIEWEEFSKSIDEKYSISNKPNDIKKDDWETQKSIEICDYRRDFCLRLHKEVLEQFVVKSMNKYCIKWGAFTERPDGVDSFGLGLEQINTNMLLIKKKKYVKNTVWSEGTFYNPMEKLNPKGVEMNQGSKPKFVRDSLKKITILIMKQRGKFNMREIIEETKIVKDMFLKSEIENLCEVIRVNEIYKYVVSDNPLMFISGTPKNSRAAAIYNNWVKTKPECSRNKLITNSEKIAMYSTSGKDKFNDVFAYPVIDGLPATYPNLDNKLQFESLILNPINSMLCLIDGANALKYDLNDIDSALF